MDLGHPALKDMVNLGCKSQVKILLAFQTYLELCEVHKARKVEYFYSHELDLIFLTALVNEEEEIYVPLSINDGISPQKIQSYQKVLMKDYKTRRINIAIRDADTSCVIYKISDGLEIPTSLEAAKEKKDLKEKRGLIEMEIINILPTLVQEARKKEDRNLIT